jgi:hypothetical protein
MKEDLLKIIEHYGEVWKDINGYQNYQISNLGRVKSKERYVNTVYGATRKIKEKILKPVFDNRGYYVVSLYNDKGKSMPKTIHRLVAEAFLENKHDYPVINHINGIKTDNRVENLEFCSQSHNIKEAYRLGLAKPQLNGLGKLGCKNKKARKIKQIDLKNRKVLNYFYGTLDAERKTRINFRNIHLCLKGKRKSAGGYGWELC